MLEIRNLSAGYSEIAVLHDLSVGVEAGQFVSIVGPNGAGKSTLFKTISGTVKPMGGEILFDGENLMKLAPAARPHLGIAHVPEGRQVFSSLTVLENLEMGAITEAGKKNWAQTLEQIYSWLPVLEDRAGQFAGTLSGGEQQMVAIARGMMARPKLLMFDEPSLGLAPIIVSQVFEVIAQVAATGTTVLIVEQNVFHTLKAADRGYVLENGRMVLSDDAETLLQNDHVRQAYLGI